MVRDGLVSEAQRGQALELIERQEGLRQPAALQQLGIFDVEALRRILARQAKTIDQVRLSVHQQRLLSQVDGQTPLGSLCNASTMMDYEVARFFYLMVKAGVLQVVSAGWPFIIS